MSITTSNYLQTTNRWNLPAPSAWWLKKLFDQDAQLVVFPSQIRPAYVLARRRFHSNAMAELNTMDKDLLRKSAGMDGDILADHNLIYVRHLMGNTIKRFEIFQWLRDHDIQANGGAEKVTTHIETLEEDAARRTRQHLLDDIDQRAKDAWRSYQARTGRRSSFGQRRQYKPSALKMPVKAFTPGESAVAAFARD